MRIVASMAGAIALMAAGCRAPADGDPWIIASPCDTVTVSDAAGIWASLGAEERSVFTEAESPAEAFINALSGKKALELLVDESGMLQDPFLCAEAESWLRLESAIAARRLALQEETALVNENDIGFWRENQGLMVWFSSDAPCPEGPFAIAELPRELSSGLHQLAPGESSALDGYGVITLDSLLQTPARTENQPDSVLAALIGGGRERFLYLREYARFLDGGETWISAGFTDLSLLPEDSVVVFSPLGQWTRSQIEIELAFFQTKFSQVEASAQWSGMILENLVMQSHYRNLLASDHPAVADSIREASRKFLLSQAAEALVREYLQNEVTVTRADLEYEYSLLTDPPLTAETRVFQLASAGMEELPDLSNAVADSAGLYGYPGVAALACPGGDSRVSRPLMRAEIPGEIAWVLFEIARNDTLTWFGPFEISQGYFAAFRLREVIPARPATMLEIEPRLNESARRRLETEAMEVFLDGIRRRFQIVVNYEVMGKLSSDPGMWASGV